MLKKSFLVLAALSLAFVAFLFLQAGESEDPATATFGVVANPTSEMTKELKPCPDKPNCVSTQATDDKKRAPISYSGTQEAAATKLLAVLDGMPRTNRETVEGDYIHYTFKTFPIPFTDDVEFLFDDASKVIHYRSASRVGHSDLGVNSKRMAKIVKAFSQQ